ASMTARGGVSGTNGPIIRLNCTLSSIRHSWNTLGCGDLEYSAGGLYELEGINGTVGVAYQPEDQWIAEIFRGDQVKAGSVPHCTLGDVGKVGRSGLRNNTGREIGDGFPARHYVR